MKTIGKKLKAIYLMAVIALVSICMSFIPLMTNTVKADVEGSTAGLRITGAQVKTIDGATQQNGTSQFAVYFHAEITEEFYGTLTGESIQFGMLVGPKAMITAIADYDGAVTDFDAEKGAVVTNQTVEAGKSANFRFVGTDLSETVEFENGVMSFEAGVVFDEADLISSGIEDVLKKAASTKLTAIPYYVVDGNAKLNALDATTRTAKDVLVETAFKVENEISTSDFDVNSIDFFLDKYVGDVEFVEGEYYFDKHTDSMLAPNANNELVAFDSSAYVFGGVASADFDGSALEDGSIFGVSYVEDGVTKIATAKVATKVLSTLKDFFNDADGSGAVEDAEMTRANYIFNLMPLSASGACNPTIAIKGLYVLANNIDLQNNGALVAGAGDNTVQIWDGSKDVGFRGTFDGRGFALLNGNPANGSGGMFGAFYAATIKNVAFVDFQDSRQDGGVIILGTAYRTKFENVYIKLKGNNDGSNSYISPNFGVTALSIYDSHGTSTFTNLVVENFDGLKGGSTDRHGRPIFATLQPTKVNGTWVGSHASDFENTAIVGMPVSANYAKSTVSDVYDMLQVVLPAETIEAFGVTAAQYALEDCAELATYFAGLISDVEKIASIDIKYINIIEDVKDRNFFVDNAALSANGDLVAVYEESGNWAKLGDALVWKSLIKDTDITIDCSAENGEFKDSVTLDMYYGSVKLDAEITLSGEGAEYVVVEGNKITRKANAQVIADKALTATLSYKGVVKSVDLTLLFDIDKVITYESGEFVIDKFTGKVLKANANKELVAYDATSYLAGDVVVGGVAQTVVNTTEFAFDKAALESLADGEKVVIASGDNYLVAQVVTKVLSTKQDFFNDADGSGAVEAAEMIQANYIFYLGTDSSSGLIRPQKTITGYYVLANNINLSGVAIGNGDGGERHYQISNTRDWELGFTGTFDGRGFALLNGNPSRGTGMFGMFYGATIKNIAFDGFTNSIGNSNGLILGRAYKSTFENIYIRATGNNGGDTWGKMGNGYTAVTFDDALGTSTINNLVFVAMSGLAEGKTNGHYREIFTGSVTAGSFTNTAIVGMPTYFKHAKHTTDTEKYVLSVTLPADAIAAFGVTAGEYALEDCPAAATAYANLITNLETKLSIKYGYINFVADTKDRDYFLDTAKLAADSALVEAYEESGYWVKLGGELLWKSLVDMSRVSISATSTTLTESVTVDMLYDAANLGATLSVSDADAKFVEISGNVVSVKADATILADKVVTIIAEYVGIVQTIDLTIPFDISKIVAYEDGEFFIDKATGKVLKADADGKLVAYDATSYLASAQAVSVGGVDQTLANTTEFAFDKAGLESLVDGRDVVILAGENALIAKVVTKVLFTVEDFFYDANEDGTVASDEMTRANYIFNVGATTGSGVAEVRKTITGYYVLANNIDLKNNGNLATRADSGEQRLVVPNNLSALGFNATLDGRGFALKNGLPGTSPGMFGLMYGATIKNIAFDGFTDRVSNSWASILGSVYCSTFENVYIRVVSGWDGYGSGADARWKVVELKDDKSTFTNVIFDNTNALKAGQVYRQARYVFMSSGNATFNNSSMLGMPTMFTYAAHATDTTKYVLTLTISSDALAQLGATADVEYTLDVEEATCPQAVLDAYAGLIGNIETKQSSDIGYIKFVADTLVGRGYYVNNASLVADSAVANKYVATGYWKVNDAGSLVWAK